MATQVHHFAITVSDMERSVAFYTRHFDLKEILRADLVGEGISSAMGIPDSDLEAVLLAGENTIFELLAFRTPKGRPYQSTHADVGAAHPCFVVDDLDTLYERMTAEGVVFNAPPQVLGWETKMAYCRDPDGLVIEVLQPGEPLKLDNLLRQS
jgi:catechol 2,3-dioxygenase-like lactoylglutathione lyase family enzyme